MKDKHNKKKKSRAEKLLKRRQDRLKQIYEITGKHCALCKIEYPPCAMEFHHTNPSNKKFNISNYLLGTTWENIEAEIRKCVLLCANCHKIAHTVRDKLFTDN